MRLNEVGFNSILVRLKVWAIFGLVLLSQVFQFHTGSIKRPKDTPPRMSVIGFNSILVRLKVITDPVFSYNSEFQFHTGSIKRLGESQIYIIQNPDRTCQVNFDCPHFLGSFAVNLQSCTFAGRSTAPDRTCVSAAFP